MQWLLVGIALFVGVGFFIRWMTEADPKDIRKIGMIVAISLLVIFAGWMLLTGKLAVMAGALAAAVPFLLRLLKIGFLLPLLRKIFGWSRRTAPPGGFGQHGGGAGKKSEIRTDYLYMLLDLETGQMQGSVHNGPYAGADLDSLGLDDLRLLYVQCCGATDQSQAVLEAYLDRRPDCADWQGWTKADPGDNGTYAGGSDHTENDSGQNNRRTSGADDMTADVARKILKVGSNATRKEINRAYKEQIKTVHPDHGGSDYLASRLNAARSLLLRLCKE